MFETLIFLALIPLALGGEAIIGIAIWFLLPVAMLVGGAGLAIVMYREPLAFVGLFWLSKRAER